MINYSPLPTPFLWDDKGGDGEVWWEGESHPAAWETSDFVLLEFKTSNPEAR